MQIVFERMQKFIILTQTGAKRTGLDEVISFVMKTCRYESHKDLCRNLEEDLMRMEECTNCNVLFEDRGSRQLYTIAYTEDDDFKNTNQNLI